MKQDEKNQNRNLPNRDEGKHNQERYIVYPYEVVEADKKLQHAQKLIFKILQQLNKKQQTTHSFKSEPKLVKNGSSSRKSQIRSIQSKNSLNLWNNEDQIDSKNRQYIQKCQVFYQTKLAQQQSRYKQFLSQIQQRVKMQSDQIVRQRQQIDKIIKQRNHLNSQITKLQQQNQYARMLKKSQKQRINQMLLKQKQQIFSKYNTLQKQTMILLDFLNKVQQITQNRSSQQQEQGDKIPYIKKIQLQATNYYSNLSNPILQQILNCFTQGYNLLNKRLQRVEKIDTKIKKGSSRSLSYNNYYNQPILRMNSSMKERQSASLQIKELNEKLAKQDSIMQYKIREYEELLGAEKDRVAKLRSKLDRYQKQLQICNKQIDGLRQKQQDKMKRIKWLQQQVVEYERRLKVQNQYIQLHQKGCSIHHKTIQTQNDYIPNRTRSRSEYGDKPQKVETFRLKIEPEDDQFINNTSICSINNQFDERANDKEKESKDESEYLEKLKQQLQKIKSQIQELNKKLEQKQEQISNKQKQLKKMSLQKQNEIKRINHQVQIITNQLENSRKQLVEKKEIIKGKDEEINRLLSTIKGIQNSILEKQCQIKQLSEFRGQIQAKDATIKKLQQEINKQNTRINELIISNNQYLQLSKQVQNQNQNCRQLRNQNQNIRNQMQNLNQRLLQSQRQRKAKQVEIQSQRVINQNSNSRIQALQMQIKAKMQKIIQLQQSRKQFMQGKQNLQNILQDEYVHKQQYIRQMEQKQLVIRQLKEVLVTRQNKQNLMNTVRKHINSLQSNTVQISIQALPQEMHLIQNESTQDKILAMAAVHNQQMRKLQQCIVQLNKSVIEKSQQYDRLHRSNEQNKLKINQMLMMKQQQQKQLDRITKQLYKQKIKEQAEKNKLVERQTQTQRQITNSRNSHDKLERRSDQFMDFDRGSKNLKNTENKSKVKQTIPISYQQEQSINQIIKTKTTSPKSPAKSTNVEIHDGQVFYQLSDQMQYFHDDNTNQYQQQPTPIPNGNTQLGTHSQAEVFKIRIKQLENQLQQYRKQYRKQQNQLTASQLTQQTRQQLFAKLQDLTLVLKQSKNSIVQKQRIIKDLVTSIQNKNKLLQHNLSTIHESQKSIKILEETVKNFYKEHPDVQKKEENNQNKVEKGIQLSQQLQSKFRKQVQQKQQKIASLQSVIQGYINKQQTMRTSSPPLSRSQKRASVGTPPNISLQEIVAEKLRDEKKTTLEMPLPISMNASLAVKVKQLQNEIQHMKLIHQNQQNVVKQYQQKIIRLENRVEDRNKQNKIIIDELLMYKAKVEELNLELRHARKKQEEQFSQTIQAPKEQGRKTQQNNSNKQLQQTNKQLEKKELLICNLQQQIKNLNSILIQKDQQLRSQLSIKQKERHQANVILKQSSKKHQRQIQQMKNQVDKNLKQKKKLQEQIDRLKSNNKQYIHNLQQLQKQIQLLAKQKNNQVKQKQITQKNQIPLDSVQKTQNLIQISNQRPMKQQNRQNLNQEKRQNEKPQALPQVRNKIQEQKQIQRSAQPETQNQRQKSNQKRQYKQTQFNLVISDSENNQNEIEENLINSKQLSMMHSQIRNFKDQLNALLETIHLKDQQIALLKAQLYKYSPNSILLDNITSQQNLSNLQPKMTKNNSLQNLSPIKKQPSFKAKGQQMEDKLLQLQVLDQIDGQKKEVKTSNEKNRQRNIQQSQLDRLNRVIIQQSQQLQKLNIQHIRHEMLNNKVTELQSILERQKQLYQNELNKNNIQIFQLQDQIRKLKQEYNDRKNKVFSDQYYSLDPKYNKFSSFKYKSSEMQTNNFKTVKGRAQTQQDQSFHSLSQRSQKKKKIKTEEQIKSGQKSDNIDHLCKIRRQKSQQYQRTNLNILKVQKLSSIQRRYDSDQKQKQQKQLKGTQQPTRFHQQSPNCSSPIQLKISNALKKQKQITKYQLISQPIPSVQQIHHHVGPQYISSSNQIIKNLAQQNKQLKYMNQKLNKDIIKISRSIQILGKSWKYQKNRENNSEVGKMTSMQKLQQNVKILQHNKLKILQEFNAQDLQTIFDNVNHLVQQTKRWVDIIQKITSQNKRMALELILSNNYPKFIKTKTMKFGEGEQPHRRSRSVYSQGNVYKQHQIDMDESPFQIQQEHPQPQHHHHHVQHLLQSQMPQTTQNQSQLIYPLNSLQILFKENNQLSQISSVKHNSYNSGFLNSRSQIAKMFEHKERHQRQHKQRQKQAKKQENKKGDIVDQYLQNQKVEKQKEREKQKLRDKQKQKQKLQKQKEKFQKQREKQKFDKNKNNVSIIQNISTSTNKLSRIQPPSIWQNSPLMQKHHSYRNQFDNNIQMKRVFKYQQKSSKSKSDFLLMLYNKLQHSKREIEHVKTENQKNIKVIKQKYEQRINTLKKQFQRVMNKIIQNKVALKQQNQDMKEVLKKQKQMDDEPLKRSNTKKVMVNRISQKDEQIYQKVDQMQVKIQSIKKQLQTKQRNICQLKDSLKQQQRKLKQQKFNCQLLKSKYMSQVSHSANLKLTIQKMGTDFSQFLDRITKKGINSVGSPLLYINNKAEAEAQVNISQENVNLLEKGKSFLKGKKVAKAQTMPEFQEHNKVNGINYSFNNTTSNNNQNKQKQGKGSESPIATQNFKSEKKQGQQKLKSKQSIVQIYLEPSQQNNNSQYRGENEMSIKRSRSIQIPLQSQKYTSEQRKQQKPLTKSDVPTQIIRVKTEQPISSIPNKQKKQMRNSNKSEDSAKSMSFAEMISNVINPKTKIKRQKTISERTEAQQIDYYQHKIGEINRKLSNLLQTQSLNNKQKQSKRNSINQQAQQRLTKTRQTQKQKQGQKQKQKLIKQEKQSQRQKREKQKDIQKQQGKIKPEDQIIKNIGILEKQIINLKQQMIKSVNQRQQRLKDILKSIIKKFKISKKSIQKIIDDKQKKDNIASKYIMSRLLFKNLYNEAKISGKVDRNSLQSSANIEMFFQQNQFQSYQQKYNELNNQNQKLRKQVEQKTKQLQSLSNQILNGHLQNRSNKLQSRNHSFASNENEQNFQDFENKQLFDNTKPSFEMIEELRMQLQHYKKKCEELELMLNKKKNQKLKYIRKW